MRFADSYRMRYAGSFLLAIAGFAAWIAAGALVDYATPCVPKGGYFDMSCAFQGIDVVLAFVFLPIALACGVTGSYALLGRARMATIALLALLGVALALLGFVILTNGGGAGIVGLAMGAGSLAAAWSVGQESEPAPSLS